MGSYLFKTGFAGLDQVMNNLVSELGEAKFEELLDAIEDTPVEELCPLFDERVFGDPLPELPLDDLGCSGSATAVVMGDGWLWPPEQAPRQAAEFVREVRTISLREPGQGWLFPISDCRPIGASMPVAEPQGWTVAGDESKASHHALQEAA